jgi:hypothetical protein
MAITNQERVGKAMELLRKHLEEVPLWRGDHASI